MEVPDVDHEYVRTIRASASSDRLFENLEASGDLHNHVVIITIPTYYLQDIRMCIVPESTCSLHT